MELGAEDLKALCAQFKSVYAAHGKSVPGDPWQALEMAIDAVFRWEG